MLINKILSMIEMKIGDDELNEYVDEVVGTALLDTCADEIISQVHVH